MIKEKIEKRQRRLEGAEAVKGEVWGARGERRGVRETV